MPVRDYCDHKAACRQGTSIPLALACMRETEGTVDHCPALEPMACGHPRTYLRWSPSPDNDEVVTNWCSACTEDALAYFDDVMAPVFDHMLGE